MTSFTRRNAIDAMRRRLVRLAAIVRRVIGVPDYDAYVAHMAGHHPGEPVLTRDEFTQTRMQDRYNRPGSRCC